VRALFGTGKAGLAAQSAQMMGARSHSSKPEQKPSMYQGSYMSSRPSEQRLEEQVAAGQKDEGD